MFLLHPIMIQIISIQTEGGITGVMPIGIQMADCKKRKVPQPQLVKVVSTDHRAVQEVKKLIPSMCHINPKERPKASAIADHLVTALGNTYSKYTILIGDLVLNLIVEFERGSGVLIYMLQCISKLFYHVSYDALQYCKPKWKEWLVALAEKVTVRKYSIPISWFWPIMIQLTILKDI